MKLNSFIRWPLVLLVIIMLLEAAAVAAFALGRLPIAGFDTKSVKPVGTFSFKDTLTCTVVHSTRDSGKGFSLDVLDHRNFTLHGLTTGTPQLYFGDRLWASLKKNYEASQYVVLEQSENQFSTETIGIMKDNGSFVRTMTGVQAGDWRYHYVVAQKGYCQ